MNLNVTLSEELVERLAAEAVRRGVSVDAVAAEALAVGLDRPAMTTERSPGRRLAFAAIGASGSTRGAAEADALLSEGFGQD